MPSPTTLLSELVAHPDPARALALLQMLARADLNAKQLFQFHEALLFRKAYPASKEIREFCAQELSGFAARVAAVDEEDRTELEQTGIVGTTLHYPYDLMTARWLHQRLGARLEVDWESYEEGGEDKLSDILSYFVEKAEEDAADDPDLSARDIIEAARGPQTAFEWISNGLARAFAKPVQSHLYDQMQLPLVMELVPPGPSRTLLDDGPPPTLFIWNKEAAREKFDLVAEIKKPLTIPLPVSPARGRELLDLTLGTLLPRLRELFPAANANPEEVYDIPLERGIRVVLFFMIPEFRLPLEVGWGCLCLKNNVPIGYGAGGMLADRSEIAINVFDTFRGGEAAWLYAQYARIFHALSRAPWLVTRKYQIGYENEEGLASGAYWFYDKLGFRSVNPAIRRLADHERRLITKRKGYRTPRRTLKKLCEADVVLSLSGEPAERYAEFPLAACGQLASRVIAEQFSGQRDHLQARVLNALGDRFGFKSDDLTASEQASCAQLGLLLLALPNVAGWPQDDTASVLKLARFKGSAREADYVRLFHKNLKFFAELKKKATAR
jgi:hypothetical protein